ncbi:cyclin-dependent kinase inhibitor 1-like isoform X1 [Oryzias latipes]|nr:cyclin-dependent kinase inhibitor 1-like isoform X1 [Oryzias latipes]XP_023810425.1 cyclin-dependent kinase inhibitor 1-like isoform X1 [Oryzias latipes]
MQKCRTMAAPKRIPAAPRRPARRNLFGPVDREQLQLEYQAALRKDLDEASLRWGFDFRSDKPLEGSHFLWESVPGAGVPLLYRCQDAGRVQKTAETRTPPKRRRSELPQREKENIPLTENIFNVEKTPEKEEKAGMKRKQTNITDFYQAKRRMVWMPRKSGE